ncbi:ATP-binding protein [Salinicola rhizosphaerae]|uniref:histidine kinase n=1 Tax=Salinicola rhizosphaerae TaxID=1443141 RepID=A0ABQ3E8U9_9GAMM|nr:ATP-binding protein [Salinicola rhizosphaerae]GHB27053.1 two-component sensor histidine kinase [Salinicola rhizosphaerae]
MTSIRRYLNLTLAGVLIAVMALAVTAAYLITRHEMEEIFDAQLSLQARVVSALVDVQTTPEEYAAIAEQLSQPDHFARWYGEIAGRSTHDAKPKLYDHEERVLSLGFWNAQKQPVLMGARWNEGENAFPAPSATGHRWVDYAGHRWRVFSMAIAGGRWVSVGLRDSFQSELSNKVALGNFVPLLLALPLLIWLIARLIRRGLKPIGQLSRQVETRDEKDLSAIRVAVPRELQPLRGALNGFIERLEQTLERERRFTADAAHELRTPLAAMKIHLDNARFGEPAALDKAYNGIERLQRVVEQLLLLARLDIHQQPAEPESFKLEPLILDLAADLWPLAEAQHQSLEIADSGDVSVEGNPTELGILIRNLMDNALRYTPEGGGVSVEKGYDGRGRAWLAISDSGPGIPDALLDAVTQRFQRASDQRISGSGLGLAIAAEIAERQGLTLTLSNRLEGGLEVRLVWTRSVSATPALDAV